MNISRKRIPGNGSGSSKLVIDGITNEENILAFVLCCLNNISENFPFYVICMNGTASIYKCSDVYYGNGDQHALTRTYTLKDGVLTINGLGLGFPAVLLTFYK